MIFFTYILTTFVILWGALVRATHSGAGCGSHWPLCDGELIPLASSVELLIEFTHRLTSGLSAIFVFYLWYHRKKLNLKYLNYAALFMLIEVLIGASIVLFGWVKDNSSVMRAVIISFHLVNSFLLLASLNLSSSVFYNKNFNLRKVSFYEKFLIFLFLIVGSFGAITALGDTLFPSTSLIEGMSKDFMKDSHFLLSLRVYHPLFAVIISFLLIRYSIERSEYFLDKKACTSLILSIVFQVLLGILTLVSLAPVYMQIIHLLGSIIVWHFLISLVSFSIVSASNSNE